MSVLLCTVLILNDSHQFMMYVCMYVCTHLALTVSNSHLMHACLPHVPRTPRTHGLPEGSTRDSDGYAALSSRRLIPTSLNGSRDYKYSGVEYSVSSVAKRKKIVHCMYFYYRSNAVPSFSCLLFTFCCRFLLKVTVTVLSVTYVFLECAMSCLM